MIVGVYGSRTTPEGDVLNDNESVLEEMFEHLESRGTRWILSGTFVLARDEDALEAAFARLEEEP